MTPLPQITEQANKCLKEVLDVAGLEAGDIFVVGCSSSEIIGGSIGKNSSMGAAKAVFDGIYPVLKARGIYLAVQCCEHLNRTIIIEKEAVRRYGLTQVNVVPQQHAGGAFATTVYANMNDPVAVEHVKAKAGMDIGLTMIGMHLCEVAVPVRTEVKKIGDATVVCARTRPKFVGGERAVYNQGLQ